MSSSIKPLEMTCESCKISATCYKKGSSPLNVQGRLIKCRILNGYSKIEVDDSKLSDTSKELKMKNGPCLSIAEVPTLVESGHMVFEVVKIFHHPILHPREKTTFIADMMYPKSHK